MHMQFAITFPGSGCRSPPDTKLPNTQNPKGSDDKATYILIFAFLRLARCVRESPQLWFP